MIIENIYTGAEEMTLKVLVRTASEQNIRIIVKDSKMDFTVLMNRYAPVNGDFVFYVNMPLVRNSVDLILVNDADGSDNGFEYLGYEKLPLEKRLDVIDFTTYHLNEFLRFIQKFCYNCGLLEINDPANDKDYYVSEKNHFFIKYLDVITDYETGQPIETPARICVNSGLIEVSKQYFRGYTVPMRMATLLHEYSHPYINTDKDNETEADINGLIIYLGLGYPRIEAAEAWCQIFINYPTDQNVSRIDVIRQFITDFDNNQIVIN